MSKSCPPNGHTVVIPRQKMSDRQRQHLRCLCGLYTWKDLTIPAPLLKRDHKEVRSDGLHIWPGGL